MIPHAFTTANQQYGYPELTVPITSKTVLYEESVVGRDIVSAMLNNPAPPGSATASILVQFYDSKDLYAFNYTPPGPSPALEVVNYACIRKAQAHPTIPVIPALNLPQRLDIAA